MWPRSGACRRPCGVRVWPRTAPRIAGHHETTTSSPRTSSHRRRRSGPAGPCGPSNGAWTVLRKSKSRAAVGNFACRSRPPRAAARWSPRCSRWSAASGHSPSVRCRLRSPAGNAGVDHLRRNAAGGVSRPRIPVSHRRYPSSGTGRRPPDPGRAGLIPASPAPVDGGPSAPSLQPSEAVRRRAAAG